MSQLKMPPQLTFSGKAEANWKSLLCRQWVPAKMKTVMRFFFSHSESFDDSQTLEACFTLPDINQIKIRGKGGGGCFVFNMGIQNENANWGTRFFHRGVNIVPDELPYSDWDLRQSNQRKIITREHKTDQLYWSIVICKADENTQISLWNLWRLNNCPILWSY